MFKLLFLTHTGTGQPPAALFIARQLIQDADLEDRIEAESARIEDCKGEPLCEEGKNALEAAGFPVTPKSPFRSNGRLMTTTTSSFSSTTPITPPSSILWAARRQQDPPALRICRI